MSAETKTEQDRTLNSLMRPARTCYVSWTDQIKT